MYILRIAVLCSAHAAPTSILVLPTLILRLPISVLLHSSVAGNATKRVYSFVSHIVKAWRQQLALSTRNMCHGIAKQCVL